MKLFRAPLNVEWIWGASVAVIGLALLAGFLVVSHPWIVIPFAVVAGLLGLNTVGRQTERLFFVALAFLLFGFIFYSKAFSYVGIPPLYISEPVLVLGLLSLVFARVRRCITSLHLLIIAFLLLGLLRTVPYATVYGIDALRDSASWYYALFAIIVSLLLSRERLVGFLSLYARVLPIVTVWLALMSIFFRFAPGSLRRIGAAPFPVFYSIKAGDRAVILVSLAAFVIVGLYARFRKSRGSSLAVFWSLWSLCALLVIVGNRGGMLGIAVAFIIVVYFRPSRQLFQAAFVGTVLFSMLLLVNPTIDLGGARSISAEQIRANVFSVFTDDTGNTGGLQNTKEWRLEWWGDIVDQTFRGPYFWNGQGFGINLADEYGFQSDGSLRSPHSIHMTILARMGVPGFLLWIGINCAFALQLVRVQRRARRQNQLLISDVAVWLLAIWAASLVNGSFDVYLESPYGAIPFWCIVGAGMALPALLEEGDDHAHFAYP